jgi:bifunctional UDP-N-acetylglucosamine pyrophosphorylase/glucosamine-1-phosphate N-acetyltransferase
MTDKFVDEFLVLCGDTIFDRNDLKNIIKKQSSIGLIKVDNPEEYGIVEMDGDMILNIYEKMKKPISNIINAGIYHFDRNIFDYISKTEKSLRGEFEITDSINLMLKERGIYGIFLNKWRDVVYPWHLLDANKEYLQKIEEHNEGTIEKNVIIKGEVKIGKNSSILGGSYIEGPVIIGENCKIGPNCYIRPFTSIGTGCHIGNACEVKNSIIMDKSNVPHQNYVGDSIIGQNCNLGSGTKIANLRLDKKSIFTIINGKRLNTYRKKLGAIIGDNVQTGINSMINIGCLIGNNVFIGPGAVTSGEIASNSRIL